MDFFVFANKFFKTIFRATEMGRPRAANMRVAHWLCICNIANSTPLYAEVGSVADP